MRLPHLSPRCAATVGGALVATLLSGTAASQEPAVAAQVSCDRGLGRCAQAAQTGIGEPEARISWGPGLDLRSRGGGFSFHLGLIVHLDHTAFAEALPLGGSIGPVENRVDVRRARVYGIVNLGSHLTGRFDADSSTGELRAFENYIGTRGLAWNVRVGHTKEPITLEGYSSARHATFAERSLVAVFAPGRNVGVRADYFEKDNFSFQTGVFRDSRGFDISGRRYNYDARAVWRPLGQTAPRIVHIGGYLTHKELDGMLRLTSRPPFTGSRPLIQLEVPADAAAYAGGEFWWREGPLQVQAELVRAWVRAQPADARLHAFSVQSSWFLTGENRGYANGAFRRTVPRAEMLNGAGGWGALEIAARYSGADLADATASDAGRLRSITLGVNWYPNRWSRMVVNWVRTTIVDADVPPTSTWSLRGLIDF